VKLFGKDGWVDESEASITEEQLKANIEQVRQSSIEWGLAQMNVIYNGRLLNIRAENGIIIQPKTWD